MVRSITVEFFFHYYYLCVHTCGKDHNLHMVRKSWNFYFFLKVHGALGILSDINLECHRYPTCLISGIAKYTMP